jgi:hypothetical protein
MSGSISRFFGVRNGRVPQQPLLLDQKAEEALQRRRRPRLARYRRTSFLLLGEEGAQVRHLHVGQLDSLTLEVIQTRRNVPLVRRTSHRGKPPLRPSKAQEIGQFLARLLVHSSSFGQPPGPRWGELWRTPAYRPATENGAFSMDPIRRKPLC